MKKIKYLFFIIFGLLCIFLGTQKIQAAEPSSIVFTEIMYDAKGSDINNEWVEIFNLTDNPIGITKNWKFNDGSNHALDIPSDQILWINAGEYLILADDKTTFLNNYPDFTGQVIDTSMDMNNTSDTISLIDETGRTIDQITYKNNLGANGNGRTLEKVDPADLSASPLWQESFALGGTPGQPASQFTLPNYPQDVLDLINFQYALVRPVQVSSIVDGDTIKVSGLVGFPSDIRLLGIDCPESGAALFAPAKNFTTQLSGKSIDLVISQDPDEQIDIYGRTLAVAIYDDEIFNTKLLERGLAKYYASSNSILVTDLWQEIEKQAQDDQVSIWASMGQGAKLSELLPNPVGDDSAGEWIELYNPNNYRLDLSYFLLNQYLIPYGTTIAGKGYLILPRSQTGITLPNSGGTVKLFFPDGLLADEATYGQGGEGWTWAKINGKWYWTTKATPAKANILVVPQDTILNDEEIPLNSTPIEIKTGEAKNYENYLVKITGTVVETSGNTFYIDDGSGKIKVYIQAATGIDKPEMHSGDIFEIIGIVNLYRDAWRILPQKQEDIKLVKAKSEEETAQAKTAIKSSTATAAKGSTTASSAKAATKVASASDQISAGDGNIQLAGYKAPFWIEMLKVLTGLAGIFLIILVFRIWKMKKEKLSPGDFGDDYT